MDKSEKFAIHIAFFIHIHHATHFYLPQTAHVMNLDYIKAYIAPLIKITFILNYIFTIKLQVTFILMTFKIK
jgi:hypothetical protein